MKLNEYIKGLQDLVAQTPALGECEAIYASDDEGNDYHHVWNNGIPVKATGLGTYSIEVQDVNKYSEANAVVIN